MGVSDFLTRSERDTLYSGNINPIATFPGQGIAIFGQKTLQKAASALDRVNVRRLMIELKKFVGDQANTLVFELPLIVAGIVLKQSLQSPVVL